MPAGGGCPPAVEIPSSPSSEEDVAFFGPKSKSFSSSAAALRDKSSPRDVDVVPIDDDEDEPTPVPKKHRVSAATPIVLDESPSAQPVMVSPDISVVPCSFVLETRSPRGGSHCELHMPILVDSDNEIEDAGDKENMTKCEFVTSPSRHENLHGMQLFSDKADESETSGDENNFRPGCSMGVCNVSARADCGNDRVNLAPSKAPFASGTANCSVTFTVDAGAKDNSATRKSNVGSGPSDKICGGKADAITKKKLQREEKARLAEERKIKRQQEKLQKAEFKAQQAEIKKREREKEKWEKGKFALKSIVAEIDSKVIESGTIGGHLLTGFAEKGLSFRVVSNPIKGSILWKMNVPEGISQDSRVAQEVPYVVVVYQAEEFCDLVTNELLLEQVNEVRTQYPSYMICLVTNKLMSFIKRCEQSQYKNHENPSNWKRPSIEEVLCMLSTHFDKVHSRQCIDEAELAEHLVGLTFSLANCQYRKKLTWLSVNANGVAVSKDFVDKNLIKKSAWLKALVAIPKVQPRHAVAIWKKYPTMRSLLNVYMDPAKTVHEKQYILKDLMLEGILGNENRRLGEICSKRVYRVLMAQNGDMKTDDVEEGADFFTG